MTQYKTVFGSLASFQKGGVEVIHDNPKNYVFSNVFDVASKSAPYERIAVAKNFEYVIECARAEGESPWYTCAHDEFALCMDGSVEVHLHKPDKSVTPKQDGAVKLGEKPAGKKMGRIVLGVAQSIGAEIDPGWQLLTGHLVFLAVLVFRPRGLFPRAVD